MTDLNSIVAIKMDGEEVSLAEMLRTLKVSEKLGFLDDAIAGLLLVRAAKAEGIKVSDEELQRAVDEFRRSRGLSQAAQTHQWLQQKHWSVDDLEAHLELGILRRKLADKIATQENIEGHFAQHRRAYDRAVLAHIAVSDEALAEQLRAQLQQGADFGDLARRHSIDKATKSYGGELGIADRSSLSPAVEAAVFSAADGDVVGPIKTDMGYHLLKVHHLLLGKLDKHVAAAIRDDLYHDWLSQQRQTAKIEVPLLDEPT